MSPPLYQAINVKKHSLDLKMPRSGDFPSCAEYWNQRQKLFPNLKSDLFAGYAHGIKFKNDDTSKTLRSLKGNVDKYSIAFSILTYHKFHQLEQLLVAVYHPDNFYCIHADKKSAKSFKDKVSALVNCFPSNVFLATKPLAVYWGQSSLLEAELSCMEDLLNKSTEWNYLINLTGEEFPLVTNQQLIAILKDLNGANLIASKQEMGYTGRLPQTLPLNMAKYKGSAHFVLTRPAVYYVKNNPLAKILQKSIRNLKCNEEHFFALLHQNYNLTKLPGSEWALVTNHSIAQKYSTRYKIWKRPGSSKQCTSRYKLRNICIAGVKTLPELVTNEHETVALFVNKFLWDFQPRAWDCINTWHYHKIVTEQEALGIE